MLDRNSELQSHIEVLMDVSITNIKYIRLGYKNVRRYIMEDYIFYHAAHRRYD